MKLGTVVGVHEADPVVVVSTAEGTASEHLVVIPGYHDVIDVINDPDWHTVIDAALCAESRVTTTAVRWMPPLQRPGKVLCVALNNSSNPDRIMSGPSTPALFLKPSSSLIGHLQPIRVRSDFGRVHPEPELAVVIGEGGSDIPESEAMSHVFGYTVINDLTSPTMREADTFHYRAVHPDPAAVRYVESWVTYSGRYKGADTFGPLGPWVVPKEDIPDPHALRIRCKHDGQVVTEDSTANLRFSVAEVISFASHYLTLEAGDVIAMGTALRRSGQSSAVQNVDLVQRGGTIEIEIEGIGALINPVEKR